MRPVSGLIFCFLWIVCSWGTAGGSDSAARLFGTAIITIIDPANGIIVAADSKELEIRAGRKEPVVLSRCKISRMADKLFFVASGYTRSSGKYDAARMVLEAYQLHKSASKALDVAESRIQRTLEKDLEEHRKESPEQFDKYLARPLEMALFGSESGNLFRYATNFEIQSGPGAFREVKVTRYRCPGKSCPGGQAHMVFTGKTTGIDRYYKEHPPVHTNLSELVAWVRQAMKEGIKAEPELVGPPIDIIWVPRHGAFAWIEVKKECKS